MLIKNFEIINYLSKTLKYDELNFFGPFIYVKNIISLFF